MTHHKLPDGWEYNPDDDCLVTGSDGDEVYASSAYLYASDAEQIPHSVALAVIRNAGADPVFEVAKRLVNSTALGTALAIRELRELIESLEEP